MIDSGFHNTRLCDDYAVEQVHRSLRCHESSLNDTTSIKSSLTRLTRHGTPLAHKHTPTTTPNPHRHSQHASTQLLRGHLLPAQPISLQPRAARDAPARQPNRPSTYPDQTRQHIYADAHCVPTGAAASSLKQPARTETGSWSGTRAVAQR